MSSVIFNCFQLIIYLSDKYPVHVIDLIILLFVPLFAWLCSGFYINLFSVLQIQYVGCTLVSRIIL